MPDGESGDLLRFVMMLLILVIGVAAFATVVTLTVRGHLLRLDDHRLQRGEFTPRGEPTER